MEEGVKNDDFWSSARSSGDLRETGRLEKTYGPRRTITRETEISSDSPTRAIRKPLPPLDTLPEPIQDFIAEIEDAPMGEKLFYVHKFVNSNMFYSQEQAEQEFRDDYDFSEVISDWKKGDCDNHTTMAAGLLEYAGFDRKDMAYLSVKLNTGYSSYDTAFLEGYLHSVLIVDGGEEKIVLDMNYSRPLEFTSDYTYEGLRASDEAPENASEYLYTEVEQFLRIMPYDNDQASFISEQLINFAGADIDKDRVMDFFGLK